MKRTKEVIKTNRMDILLSLLIPAVAIFLFKDLLYGVLSAVLSSVISFMLIIKKDEILEEKKRRLSSLTFFSSFIALLRHEAGTRKAYEQSVNYLMGYYQPLTYDVLLESREDVYCLKEMFPYFRYILDKDKKDESYLLDLTYLEKIAKERRDLLQREIDIYDTNKKKDFILSAVLISFVSLFSLITGGLVVESENGNIISLILVIAIAMVVPSIHFTSFLTLRRKGI